MGEVLDRKHRFFAEKAPSGVYMHFFKSRVHLKLCGCEDPVIVDCRERTDDDPESRYWGWLPADDDEFCMIQPSLIQLDICFPDGVGGAERSGRGQSVNLIVIEVEETS